MKLAVLDLETDPFEYGRVPQPFAWGYYDGEKFLSLWDDTGALIPRSMDILKQEEPAIIYAHNGGRFDWFYYLTHLERGSNLKIVNGRIIQAMLGHHEIRDSFAIMPFALDKYQKTKIEYKLFERQRRAKHRDEILSYLRDDCTALHELVTAYWKEFGNVLTIGSAALRELKKLHKYRKTGSEFDKRIRSNYYYGGRVQVLGPAVVKERVSVYDVNSMYPYVMASTFHPVSSGISVSKWIEADTCFVACEGYSHGAFPVRTKTGIDFPTGNGLYTTTIHEYNAALETGRFKLKRIHKTYGFSERVTFADFVMKFYEARLRAEHAGDKIHKLFYKFVLNSCYGKFAQNPENYFEYEISGIESRDSAEWTLDASDFEAGYMIWKKPCSQPNYHNIATAASITGAARAELLRGLCSVERPYYCDTDSIIAAGPGTLNLSESDLGGWKTEVSGDSIYFGGKKIYGLFDDVLVCPYSHERDGHKNNCGTLRSGSHCLKKAHKGFKASGRDIQRIAAGEVITWRGEVPHFSMSGNHGFVERRIRRTI